jgi:hypothetical protein
MSILFTPKKSITNAEKVIAGIGQAYLAKNKLFLNPSV